MGMHQHTHLGVTTSSPCVWKWDLGLCSGQARPRTLPGHLKSVALLQKHWLLWLNLDNLPAFCGYPLQSILPHHFTPKIQH